MARPYAILLDCCPLCSDLKNADVCLTLAIWYAGSPHALWFPCGLLIVKSDGGKLRPGARGGEVCGVRLRPGLGVGKCVVSD